ncbi:MAG: thiamine pyrophosphate-dependent dehydrogenase E1 component subunit alpha [Caulobacterales bacterium]
MNIPTVDTLSLLRAMMLIRAFEAALIARPDHGFQLLSSGQEAVAVGLCSALSGDDQLLSSGRAIGPALARGVDPGQLMAELIGRASGPSRGKGGRGHLAQPSAGFFGAHAVVGGNLTIAAGVALAFQLERRPGVVACVFGDGACGSGALHETMNIAAIWKLPLVLVCDNNQLSVATPRDQVLAPKRLSDLAAPFGLAAATVDGMDVLAVREAAAAFVARARAGEGPAFLECLSERFSSHSTATRETRSPQAMAKVRARCPIDRLAGQLRAEGLLDQAGLAAVQAEVRAEVARAIAFAEAAPRPDPAEALSDVV